MRLVIPGRPDWPALTVSHWDTERREPYPAQNVDTLAQALDQGFIAAGAARPMMIYMSRLFPGGFLPVPLEVVEPDGHVPVFIYPDTSTESAAHFLGARALLAERGVTAVYCAPDVLDEMVAPANPLRWFDPNFLGPWNAPSPHREFAMWWPTDEERDFASSKCFSYYERLHVAADGIESYLLAHLARALGLMQFAPDRVVLPLTMESVPITGPDLRQMYFGASIEKGIRFRFSLDTPAWFRDEFTRLFCEYVEAMKAHAVQEGWPPDPDEQRKSLAWWQFFKTSAPKMMEQNPANFRFGPLMVAEPAGPPPPPAGATPLPM